MKTIVAGSRNIFNLAQVKDAIDKSALGRLRRCAYCDLGWKVEGHKKHDKRGQES